MCQLFCKLLYQAADPGNNNDCGSSAFRETIKGVDNMKKIRPVYSSQDIPLGLSMAMAQNTLAYDVFARLSPTQKKQLINDSSRTNSPQEMQQLVDNMACSGSYSADSFM